MIKDEEKPVCKKDICPKCKIETEGNLISINKDGTKNYRCLRCDEWWEVEPKQKKSGDLKYKYDWSNIDLS